MTIATTPIKYPSLISRACAALDEAPIFRDAPDGYLRIFIRIIKKINLKNLTSSIFAKRSTLAEESGKSVETVHRAIHWLEQRELVEREQKAHKGLRGSSSPLTPTKKLLDALLLTDIKPFEARTPDKTTAVITTADIAADNQPAEIQSNQFITINKKTIPLDLARLVRRNGVNVTGVLQLMSLAKKFKQRLSDVLSCVEKYVANLPAGKTYAYLRTCIKSGRDFKGQLQEAARATQQEQTELYLKHKGEALLGRHFRTKDGQTVFSIEQAGVITKIYQGTRITMMMNLAFLSAIENGRLVPVRDWA